MNNEYEYDSNDKSFDGDSEEKNKKSEKNLVQEIFEIVIYFGIIIVVFLLIQSFVGQHIEVNGTSMENTLQNKDHLILEKVTYRFNEPKRFDIVVFRPYEDDKDTYYIKRVIGLPGERIWIRDGQIYVNEQVVEEDYGNEVMRDAGIAETEIILGDDEYFLLGDNRNNSKDSRDPEIGVVHRSAILGRGWARIWPISKIGVLEHQ